MRSIVYGGHDLSDVCSAEVVSRSAAAVEAQGRRVPGRAGELLVATHVPPAEVVVRLYWDLGTRPRPDGMARARAEVRRWLSRPAGAALVLPDDCEVEYRDAVLTRAGGWSGPGEDASCELTFTLFDPVGWGAERREATTSFDVGGTWRTHPELHAVAAAGQRVAVTHVGSGRTVCVERRFSGGERVVFDCGRETVTVDGADACDCVTLGSDFFCLEPGGALLSTAGCASLETRYFERWA